MIDDKRKNRWFFGGLAGACAVGVTHPLDLLKVQLQVPQTTKMTIFQRIQKIYIMQGYRGFYNGISASLVRQMTYTSARFGIYEIGKNHINEHNLYEHLAIAALAGMCGGIIGVPSDIVNIRMQNDMMLPPQKRRNYKHVFDGLYSIMMTEGPKTLFNGGTIGTTRTTLLNISQLVVYERLKFYLLNSLNYNDNILTHFLASCGSAAFATFLTHPLDVVKTRVMNERKTNGVTSNIPIVLKELLKEAPLSFYKGILPSFLRIGPQTVLTFLIMEQMRLHFGYLPSIQSQSPALATVSLRPSDVGTIRK